MSPRDQARLLGLFFWIYAGMQVVMVAIISVVYVLMFSVFATQIPHGRGDPPPELLIPMVIIVMAIIFVVVVLFAIPKVIAGYGLRNGKPWARVWAIVASSLALLSFPLGTTLGVFGLIFTIGEQGKAYFEGGPQSMLGQTEPPPVTPPEPMGWQ